MALCLGKVCVALKSWIIEASPGNPPEPPIPEAESPEIAVDIALDATRK
jgi:hypothetical protein